ncbi:MAG TPA: hypothetical protein VFP65_11620 [Anaeromyxobacteraceae bacterium]|nr:hypothetical protein [Anaeromyxobacteraceae bacterium]
MEYALRVLTPRVPAGDPRDLVHSAPAGALPAGPVVALYFGTEFCEDRLPDAAEAEAFCVLSRDRGWMPTLLTPVVTDDGLARIDGLLARLGTRGWRLEVVFNDWGVLRLLRERHARHAARAGRLLNRALRDPRAFADGAGAEHRRERDPARGTRLRRLLAGAGVVALETDPDLDGGYLGDGDAGLSRALHVPYVFASSGRNCLLKAGALPGRAMGELLGDACPRPCRGGAVRADRQDCTLPLWRAGNTLLYEVPWGSAQAHLAEADRVVVHEAPSP